jgi:osmotically-inducible protein OsmY
METDPDRQIIQHIESRLTRDTRIERHKGSIAIQCEKGHVLLQGIAPSVRAKRLAPLLAREVEGVRSVEDHLLVAVADRMGAKEISQHIRNSFLQDRNIEEEHLLVDADDNGGVILRGAVHSIVQRRLCEVLCWWVPGVASVRNFISVDPPDEDSDEELKDNLLVIMDKDVLVDPTKFLVEVRHGRVRLQGRVDTPTERDAAEKDCWYTPGVTEVVNELTVE